MGWQFLNTLLQPREIAGVEIRLVEQDLVCDYVIVQKKSGKVVIVEKSEASLHFDALLAKLSKSIPLCLVLGGKGVILKKHAVLSDNIEEALGGLFPNIQIASFAYQHIRMSKNSVIALARLEQVASLIRKFNDAGHEVLNIDLAFGSLPSVMPMLKGLASPLATSEWELTPSEDGLADFSPHPPSQALSYQLGDDAFTSNHLASLAACLHTFLGPVESLQNVDVLLISKQNYKYKQLFRFAGISFLAFMLVALLVNTFLYFSWSEKLQQQSLSLATQGNVIAKLDSLQSQYSAQRQFLEKNSLGQSSLTSWYADQIGASMVGGIRLIELQIFPANPESKKDENSVQGFLSDRILVKGNSQRSVQLNEWIKKLQSLPWVKEVKVMPYSENREGKGEFELQISINGL